MLKQFLLVGIGGALGSMLRYGANLLVNKTVFPWTTFAINCSGSFLIGAIAALALRYDGFSGNWKLFLATGICGGFTTFSTFSLENVQLLQDQRYLLFTCYAVGSLLLGITAAFIGFKLFHQ